MHGPPKRAPGVSDPTGRRQQILTAAAEVFADKGFYKTRVSDIAQRAGVAHGLIYHYFPSKDALLQSIFEDHWGLFLKVLEDLRDQSDVRATEKLTRVAVWLVEAMAVVPSIIQVIIQEVSRSRRYVHPEQQTAFQSAFKVVQSIIEDGQAHGDIDPELERATVTHMFFGAMETVCTGFILGHIRYSEPGRAEAVKKTFERVLVHGISTKRAKA
ncbi:MAG TPA: TetR/AcrR family transcriptional regulator [Myxococcales bacterium LLY-WYZ-16_1]|nr:TetR/AcrR family transcriptional regulator [Myxococcales bacterium LLY-WYZ-16_1]